MAEEPLPGSARPPSREPFRSVAARWGAAAAVTCAAFWVKSALPEVFVPPFILFYPAVMVTALLFGPGAGLFATALSIGFTVWRVLHPFGPPIHQAGVSVAVFACMGTLLSVVAHLYRESRRRLSERERENVLREASERVRASQESVGRTRNAAHVNRAELEAVFQAMSDGVAVFDMQGHMVLLNEAEARMNGYPTVDAMKRDLAYFASVYELWDLEGKPVPVESWPVSQVLRGESLAEWELRGRRRDTGQEWVFAFSGGPVRDAVGKQVFAVVITRDITERIRATGALRASEERFRLFAEHAPAAVALFDREMRYLAASRRYAADYRLSGERFIGRSHYDVFPEIPERWKEIHRRCLAGAVESCEEDPFPRADGTTDWVRWEMRPWWTPAGEIGGVALFSEVITDRKLVADALAAEKERLAVTLQSIGDAVIATDERSRVTLLNPVAERLTGWSAAEAVGRPLAEVFHIVSEDTGEPAESPVERVFREGVVVGLANHTSLVARDGQEHPIADSGAPIRGPDRRVRGAVLVFRDQTAARETEEALRASEERYRFMFEKAGAGVALVDSATGRFLQVNARFAEMLGLTREEMLASHWEGLTHPDDLDSNRAGVRAMQASGEPYRAEKRYLRKDGGVVWARLTVSQFALSGETPLAQVAIAEDITRQREATVALAERERELRKILTTAMDGFWVVDSEGRLIDVNEAYCAMSGYTREELLRARIADLEALETPEETAAHVRRIMGQGSDRFETRHRRKDGQSLDIEASVNFIERTKTFVCFFRDITERKRAEEALRRSEERFRALIEKSTDMILVIDAEGRYRFWSQGAVEVLGYTSEEMLGRPALLDMHPEDQEHMGETLQRLVSSPGSSFSDELRYRHKSGAWRRLQATARNLLDDPAVQGVVVNARDVTEQRSLEEQFWQAQKLESIGRLAGGVAHDFNNLLTVVLSGVEELRARPEAEAPDCSELVQEIGAAGERARELTRQLLAFARRQVIMPESLDLGAVVREGEGLLRRLLGEDVELVTRLGSDLWPVRCDRGQIDQVILNLAVNARDAMPRGGTLAIETSNVEIDEAGAASRPGLRPGAYVRLAVRDSGAGMSPEAQAHIFEPFFTTKGVGKGTGLGLATVYGIVKQSEGFIYVESEPDRGSTFEVFLPRTLEKIAEARQVALPTTARGTETILVVEDDAQVRTVTVRALQAAGYQVLVASDGPKALELAARAPGRIHLLLTDIVMPGLNGSEVAQALARLQGDIRVLYVSGYTADAIAERGVLDSGVDLLQKPFTPASLLARIRETLDRAPPELPS